MGRIIAAALGFVAGFADAYGYIRWQAFGANMTGNTIVFAVSLYRDARHAILPLALILAFLLGAVLGRAIVARFSPSISLTCEAALLAVAGFVPNALALGVIALAMGIQNTAFATFAGVRANTSFLSGDYTNLGRALADLLVTRDESDENPSAISILAPVIAAYVAGAGAGGLLSSFAGGGSGRRSDRAGYRLCCVATKR